MTDINAMTEQQRKTYGDKLRRIARRQGLVLLKSRTRDERALTYGKFMILDERTNAVVAGGALHGYSMPIDEVERYLTGEK